jgi:hypothetical protein
MMLEMWFGADISQWVKSILPQFEGKRPKLVT